MMKLSEYIELGYSVTKPVFGGIGSSSLPNRACTLQALLVGAGLGHTAWPLGSAYKGLPVLGETVTCPYCDDLCAMSAPLANMIAHVHDCHGGRGPALKYVRMLEAADKAKVVNHQEEKELVSA